MARSELLTVVLPSGTVAVARGRVHGLPAFTWGQAPAELVTLRQLAAERLRPARRSDPAALLVWGRRSRRNGLPVRWARLYDIHTAQAKAAPRPHQARGLAAAFRARRTCRNCGPVDHFTRAGGLCATCFASTP
uniref:RRQRL motif-containing zinc-binding protein n=1 Tax=Saccharothrix espanaensis TaxID=103731 RepID=UPI003F491D4D